jgi:hypothetical protein
MSTIKIEMHKCDELASRFYNVGAGDKQRAAGDWLDQVKKVANMIKTGQINSECNKNTTLKNKKGGFPATFKAISGSKNVAI